MILNIRRYCQCIFTIYSAQLVPHLVLYFLDVVHSTRKQCAYLGFSERTQSTSFFFYINGDTISSNYMYYKPFKAPVLLVLYQKI